ncbi:Integrator complex subunit 9, partial [Pseudolycoriella hygida]
RPDKPLITFKREEVIKLPRKRKRNRVFLTPEIAATIVQKEVKPGLSLSTLTGYLQVVEEEPNKKTIPTRAQFFAACSLYPAEYK